MKKFFGRNDKEAKIINKLKKYNQDHVLYFWNDLTDSEKDTLIYEISNIDQKKILKYYNRFKEHKPQKLEPKTTDYLSIEQRYKQKDLKSIGENALKNNEVAFLTVAGGQGSRLGYDHPKGFFPISPIKNKSLFRIFAEKLLAYSEYYQNDFNWYIMTSEFNYKDTIKYFKDNNYFNLNKKNVVFFKQGMFPTLNLDGKLILTKKNRLFLNPDGHGGILKALLKIGLLDEMQELGIKHLSYFQVDNPLVNMADPYFIGYHIKERSMVSSKVIAKKYPDEKLGAICKLNNINSVIEYSDLSDEDMNAKDKNGKLKYLMGSIAIHIFDIQFLMDFTKKIPIHFAQKNIAGYVFKDNKEPVIDEMNGIKFETFVFDSIPLAERSVFFETERENEFYPLKNKKGLDSIATCQFGQSQLFFNWLKETGVCSGKYNDQKIEISPLFAPDVEIFLEKVMKKTDKLKKEVLNSNRELKNEIYIE